METKENKLMKRVIISAAMILASFSYVFAEGDADSMWTETTTFIFSWIARIGFLVGVFGAVQIGLSFASDNPDARVRGVQFLVAGCIVFAVGMSPHFVSI